MVESAQEALKLALPNLVVISAARLFGLAASPSSNSEYNWKMRLPDSKCQK
jgi:hypothetical protein